MGEDKDKEVKKLIQSKRIFQLNLHSGGSLMLDLSLIKDSLRFYFTRVDQFPILTPEEEFQLAVRYRENNDVEAGHKLVTSNLKFVVKIAFEYRFYGIPFFDLIQEGNIGLMTALKKFDPYRGYRFNTYAVWWIKAYIQKFIIKNWSLVKFETANIKKKLFYKIGKINKELDSKQEEKEILAEGLRVQEEDTVDIDQMIYFREFSLDNPNFEDQELNYIDLIQEDSPNQEEKLAQVQEEENRKNVILNAMKSLNQKEAYVIKHRMMADPPLTLEEIGAHLKLSRERVRQIETKALEKLKKAIEFNKSLIV